MPSEDPRPTGSNRQIADSRLPHPDAVEHASPLHVLGLDGPGEQVYRLVLRGDAETVDDLSRLSGLAPARVRRYVEHLRQLRLVRGRGDRLQAEAPDFALGRLVVSQEARLRAEQTALESVRSSIRHYVLDHERGTHGVWDPVPVDAIDVTDIVPAMEALLVNSEGEMLFMRPDQWSMEPGHRMDQIVLEALRGGRTSRVLYPDQISGQPPDLVRQRVAAGERLRLLPVVPVRLAVFGDSAALIPEFFDQREGRRLVVRQPGLVASLRAFFELHWSRAVAPPAVGSDQESEALVQLLAAGAKDEQIARMLGISLRTVRRRIAVLLDDLGASSRFQAGAEAVRRGLL